MLSVFALILVLLLLVLGCEAHFGRVGWSLANGFCAEGPMDIKLGHCGEVEDGEETDPEDP